MNGYRRWIKVGPEGQDGPPRKKQNLRMRKNLKTEIESINYELFNTLSLVIT